MSSDKPKPLLKRVDLAEIAPGPVLRERLSDSQLETVRAIYSVVKPFIPSFDDFELGFRRDTDPDSELRIWTGIAMAYQRFTEVYRDAQNDEREAAYTCILLLMSNEEAPPPNVPETLWNRCREIIESQTRAALLGKHRPLSELPVIVYSPRKKPE